MTKMIPWVGHWSEPWNRSPWDRCLWQIKWENWLIRRLSDLRSNSRIKG
jgi:hypothetical protein